MSSANCRQSISAQAAAVREGSVTAQTLAWQVREDIVRREPSIRAWVELSNDLDAQAYRIDSGHLDGPLAGVSLGVKDLVDVAGLPTLAGSTVTSTHPQPDDAACVARFRALGAIVQGKTVTTEFGYFAPGPTRNPHAPDHTPGGSSSGSAAAVGAGVVPVALGTQTAGSLTRPASFCGAAGLVLSQGTADLTGITGLSDSLDSLGLLARSTEDLRYVYAAFAGLGDITGVESPRKARLWTGSELGVLDPSMQKLLALLPTVLNGIGVKVEEFESDDHVRTLADDHATVMSYEAAGTLHETFERHGADLSTPLRELVRDGRSVTADSHAAALVRRDRSRRMLSEILGDDTVIIGPAALGPAPQGLDATGSPILSRPWQLLGAPVIVVPGARTPGGLPLGLQIIAPTGHEAGLFDVAVRLEPALRAISS
ncbi:MULTISPECIES: amidase [unclassified Rhodococcus (in: high G+C Gram-positive bacteria)]|uniref:amidase n=1 Tax=unclassified Rhodococcus (in: high G+C Gram-positive bacteria) TaxID=192944 RepID=UPI00096A7586|nr:MULTISPECIES: amidase [unclassified Rhodococcus (in: high G+C Gram-positive bacteria)]